jgi:hypothetical protein
LTRRALFTYRIYSGLGLKAAQRLGQQPLEYSTWPTVSRTLQQAADEQDHVVVLFWESLVLSGPRTLPSPGYPHLFASVNTHSHHQYTPIPREDTRPGQSLPCTVFDVVWYLQCQNYPLVRSPLFQLTTLQRSVYQCALSLAVQKSCLPGSWLYPFWVSLCVLAPSKAVPCHGLSSSDPPAISGRILVPQYLFFIHILRSFSNNHTLTPFNILSSHTWVVFTQQGMY